MVGGRPENIAVIAVKAGFVINLFNTGDICFMTGKADSFCNKIGDILGLTASGGVND
jgi:hypothetical protein